MRAVAYSTFRSRLKAYMKQVNQDADELLVTNNDPGDNVVVMSARDYDSLMETLRIYQNPPLYRKIRNGMDEIGAGKVAEHPLSEPGDEL